MPLIISPEPHFGDNHPKPIYEITADYTNTLTLIDYSDAIITPTVDAYFNNYEEETVYTITMFMPIKALYPIEHPDITLVSTKDSYVAANLRTSNYTLATHIYRQLLAKQDITPDSLQAALPEVFI